MPTEEKLHPSGTLSVSDRVVCSGEAARSGMATPTTIASSLWQNSARTIGDILVLSDVISPLAYCALPFVNQALFVAGCCYVKGWSVSFPAFSSRLIKDTLPEIEFTRSTPTTPVTSPRRIPSSLTLSAPDQADSSADGKDGKQVDLSRALLTSVATTNISTLQQGLASIYAQCYGRKYPFVLCRGSVRGVVSLVSQIYRTCSR